MVPSPLAPLSHLSLQLPVLVLASVWLHPAVHHAEECIKDKYFHEVGCDVSTCTALLQTLASV